MNHAGLTEKQCVAVCAFVRVTARKWGVKGLGCCSWMGAIVAYYAVSANGSVTNPWPWMHQGAGGGWMAMPNALVTEEAHPMRTPCASLSRSASSFLVLECACKMILECVWSLNRAFDVLKMLDHGAIGQLKRYDIEHLNAMSGWSRDARVERQRLDQIVRHIVNASRTRSMCRVELVCALVHIGQVLLVSVNEVINLVPLCALNLYLVPTLRLIDWNWAMPHCVELRVKVDQLVHSSFYMARPGIRTMWQWDDVRYKNAMSLFRAA